MTPNGIPTTVATIQATPASLKVLGIFSRILWVTGKPSERSCPKSPRTTSASQSTYWTGTGLSRFSFARCSAQASSLKPYPLSETRSATGSPTCLESTNTIRVTPIRAMIELKKRLIRNLRIYTSRNPQRQDSRRTTTIIRSLQSGLTPYGNPDNSGLPHGFNYYFTKYR